MKTKILYIISLVESSHTFKKTFDYLDKEKFELSVIFMNDHAPLLMEQAKEIGITVYHIPFHKKILKDLGILFKIIKIIKKEKPVIVHAHLIDGSFFGLIAAYLCGVKHRFYTRHHSTHHWIYATHAVKYDRVINYLSTKIIAVSSLVKKVLVEKENVSAQKISIIHHGFDLSVFSNKDEDKIVKIREKYNLIGHNPIIGNISRFIEEKGVTYVIEAFKKLLINYPNAVLILANAIGNYKNEIFKKLSELPKANYRIIEFETNIASLYQCFDIFTHVPIDDHTEAFGQIYVEALAAKVPSVFTDSGIASEFVNDKVNALLVPYKDSNAIYEAMQLLMTDTILCKKIADNGSRDVNALFNINSIIKDLEKEYDV